MEPKFFQLALIHQRVDLPAGLQQLRLVVGAVVLLMRYIQKSLNIVFAELISKLS